MTGTHRIERAESIACEALVIGTGAGGGVIASELARRGYDVLMLEEGPYIGRTRFGTTATDSFPRMWRNGGLGVALGRTPVAYAEGRCVGGGTQINSAIFQRTPPELLDDWARRYRIAEFSADAMAPYFDRAAAAVHAALGQGALGSHGEKLRMAAEKMGWAVRQLERAQAACVGTNFCAFGCPTGAKQSMTETLIPGALARHARLIAECRVDSLWKRGSRIAGAIATATAHDGRRLRLRIAAEHVFLCAGAIQTPALLQRSGIRRNVGRTLRLHPTLKVAALFDEVIDAHRSALPQFAVTEFLPDLRMGGSVFQPGLFAMGLAEDWDRRAHLLEHWRQCGSYYAMVRPSGVGRVRAVPGLADPVVSFRLSLEDRRRLLDGAARLGEALLAAGGAREVFPSIPGHPGWRDAAAARAFRDGLDGARERSLDLMTIHLFSSCPPGEHACTATDSFGRVRGIENLFIADASQIPEAPGVNPQGTVMALAYRAADAFHAGSAAERRRAAAGDL